MSNRQPMKLNLSDTANGSFAGSLIVATVGGWSLQEWAAFAALFYSLLLIADKLGILQPMRKLCVEGACWCWGKVVWLWRGRTP